MKLPEHLRRTHRLRWLRMYAMGIAGYYGQPVYLCGSALMDANAEPRDWDIRVTLPDEDFALKYGGRDDVERVIGEWMQEGITGKWTKLRLRWSDDCVKQSKVGWKDTGLNIDFQVYPKRHADAQYKHKPRLRLDTLSPKEHP